MYVSISNEENFPGYNIPKGYMIRWVGSQEEIKEVNEWLKTHNVEHYSYYFSSGAAFQEYTATIVDKDTALLIKMFWEHRSEVNLQVFAQDDIEKAYEAL